MADLGRSRVGEPYVDLRRQPQRETRRRQKRSGASHALAARLYQLSAEEFEYVVGTFPLVEPEQRSAALRAYATEARR